MVRGGIYMINQVTDCGNGIKVPAATSLMNYLSSELIKETEDMLAYYLFKTSSYHRVRFFLYIL